MKPRLGQSKAHSAPTEFRRLNLKPPGAPAFSSSPSPSADPPLFQLPGSPSTTTSTPLKEEKILSRSAPSRLRRIHPEGENPSAETTSPISNERSSKVTPIGSPTIYSLLQHRGPPHHSSSNSSRSIINQNNKKKSIEPREQISSPQKVVFGLPMSTLPELGRGLKPEKSVTNEKGDRSLGDLQFEMDKDIDDRRKDTDTGLDFLDF